MNTKVKLSFDLYNHTIWSVIAIVNSVAKVEGHWVVQSALIRNIVNMFKQECIPVGCVPAARWPYAGVCFLGRGGGGVQEKERKTKWKKKFFWEGVSAPGGGCLLWGVSAPRGVSAPGVSTPGGVCSRGVSQHALRQTPLWTESQTPVKTLPWPNFVTAGNYSERLRITEHIWLL